MVFRRPYPTKFDMLDPLDGIAQERAAKLLNIIFTTKLSFEDHVDFVRTLCSHRVYLLKLLQSRGLLIQQLHIKSCLGQVILLLMILVLASRDYFFKVFSMMSKNESIYLSKTKPSIC